MLLSQISLTVLIICVDAYKRLNFSLTNETTENVLQCSNTEEIVALGEDGGSQFSESGRRQGDSARKHTRNRDVESKTTPHELIAILATLLNNPLDFLKAQLHRHLYGEKVDLRHTKTTSTTEASKNRPMKFETLEDELNNDTLFHYPDGQAMRAELFNNKSAVHFPPKEFIQRGHALLNVTTDYMQTAINAFAILLEGNVDDVQNLPAEYVLKSARTISMMKVTREKLAMLWTVLKESRATAEITYEELEMYRPLFKYVNAREIGRLNLKDTKILNFIGTHADLDRHQVGVVASKYMNQNPNWTDVKYLNHMNNLLCGVPMNFMRKIPSQVYLQLSHQVFYHIRACDPLQRTFFLGMMTKTEALGKSYSWSARDVSRLGLLLAEVQGPDLATINPESMSGITAQVMMEIPASSLQYLTEVQVEYLALKPLTIFARKVKSLSERFDIDTAHRVAFNGWRNLFTIVLLIVHNE